MVAADSAASPIYAAEPYPWPFHGGTVAGRTALIACVDERWGKGDLRDTPAGAQMSKLAREVTDAGGMVVTVVGSALIAGTGGGPTICATSTDAFHGTALDGILRSRGCTDLLLAGCGLEGPVHSTMRAANDRGYECLLVPEASVAVDRSLALPAAAMVTHSGGIFGCVAGSEALLAALGSHDASPDGWSALDDPTAAQAARQEKLVSEHQGRLGEMGVDASPYRWPFDMTLDPAHTALICIDWQHDFCGVGGYVEQMGYDISLTRAGLEPTTRVLAAARQQGWLVIHTREGHRPDLSDCPANKLWRSRRIGAGIGDPGPGGRILVRGEPGWKIVPEVAPQAGEVVVDKPGKGAFYATDLDMILRTRQVKHLVFTGITTDVCVHTTMREANDRGYECLVLSDCTGATDHDNHLAALKMVTMQGGVFGAVATSDDLLAAMTVGAAR